MLTPSPSGARWLEPQPLANPGRFTDDEVVAPIRQLASEQKAQPSTRPGNHGNRPLGHIELPSIRSASANGDKSDQPPSSHHSCRRVPRRSRGNPLARRSSTCARRATAQAAALGGAAPGFSSRGARKIICRRHFTHCPIGPVARRPARDHSPPAHRPVEAWGGVSGGPGATPRAWSQRVDPSVGNSQQLRTGPALARSGLASRRQVASRLRRVQLGARTAQDPTVSRVGQCEAG
jgi:hypothetical protein